MWSSIYSSTLFCSYQFLMTPIVNSRNLEINKLVFTKIAHSRILNWINLIALNSSSNYAKAE